MNDYVLLEMRMAEIMAQQEASGFRFDVSAAERVRGELQEEASQLERTISSRFIYVPGKVYVPKRANKTKGYVAGAPMTRLLDFNPYSGDGGVRSGSLLYHKKKSSLSFDRFTKCI